MTGCSGIKLLADGASEGSIRCSNGEPNIPGSGLGFLLLEKPGLVGVYIYLKCDQCAKSSMSSS